jgi:class 3 adenylate cyclase
LTVLFCDLVGSTALSARRDPEDMREIIRAVQDACAGVVARYDGFVAKFMGDGVLVYFGYPRAHEGDAERAVRASLDMSAAVERIKAPDGTMLRARIGVATGLVVVGDLVGEGPNQEHAAIGDALNLAARLQQVAEPGTVVIAEPTRKLLGRRFELRELDLQMVKGLAEPVAAYTVVGVARFGTRFESERAVGLSP